MDAVPVTATPDAARYMVFKYCVNRPTVAAMEPESVTDFLSMEATVNDEFFLEVRASNMQPEDEGLVHNLILQRISRGAIYAGRGQFARLERNTVYYCLVRSQAPEVTEAEQERGSFFSQEYVVCFWNEPESPQDSDTFELFRPELDKYAAVVGERFFKLDAQPIGPDVRQMLSDWRHVATHYIHRAVRALLPCLAAVLHLALLGQPLLLFGAPAIAADTQRFYEALALQQPSLDDRRKRPSQCVYVGESLSSASSLADPQAARIVLADEAAQAVLDSGAPAAVNDLCAALAGKLAAIVLTAEQTGQAPNTTSLQLRRAIEELKARIMQELSVLRRALRTAELDHYALAACAHGLTTHPNRALLLDIMHREYLVSQASDDARDVLAILRAEFAMPA